MFETHPTDFFIANSPLKGNTPSYIPRAADEELYQAVKRGEFCYVLAGQQMGKSSLIARTARRLQQDGVQTVIIDLTQIGIVTPDQWYFDFISKVTIELDLDADVEVWWQANSALGVVHRLTNFWRDVVLTECEGNIVLFVDEIDFTLSLDFTDDFFAAICAVYNNRSQDATFERLTFVLMGVAITSDLVKDQTQSPFNIGRRIVLNDFHWHDMLTLAAGLEAVYPQRGQSILSHIYRWTRGHPYLTQKLCKTIVDTNVSSWSNEQTDQIVNDLFLRPAVSDDENIAFVKHFILNQNNRRTLLNTYRQVLRNREVVDNERSPVVNQLKLSGLVKTEGGYLQNRNIIYQQIFDEQWLKKNMPLNLPLMAPITLGLIAALLIIYFAGGFGQTGSADNTALAPLMTDTPAPTSISTLSDITPTVFTLITTNSPTPTSTLIPTEMPTVTPIPTDTPTPTSTLIPTEMPTVTPIPTAVANQSAIIFMAPDTSTQELARVQTDETVAVLGRSADRFGRIENKPGLYIRTGEGIEGFVVALFFDWPGNIEALPVLQPKLAEVTFNVFLFEEPDITSEKLDFASAGEFVEVIARSGNDWFYARTAAGIEGFAQHTYFDWRGDFDALVEYE